MSRGISKFDRNFFTSWSFWAGSSALTALVLSKYAPQYTIWQSFKWTAIALFLTQWLMYSIYVVVIYPRYVSPLRHLPEPGNNSFFMGQWNKIVKEPSGLPMRQWINEIPNNGLIRYRHLFNRDRVLVTSPKALGEVLVTKSYDFVKPDFIQTGIGRILGIGVLFAEGDEHKKQRKALTPAFSFRHIKQLYPIFWTKSVEMTEGIISESLKTEKTSSELSSAPSIEIGEWASRATLDIIGVAGLGQDFNSIADPNTDLNRVYRAIFQPSRAGQILGLLQFFIPPFIIQNLPIKRNDDVHAASRVARETSMHLIEEKKRALAANKELPPDIISIALESGGFTDLNLVDNMMTFLAAGHETTASALTWALYLMCKNPGTQEKLRDEVRQHIPDPSNRNVTNEILDNMPYLHAVCNETLRLYSPVPLTLRDTAVPTTIVGQYIPRGTKVILCPWAVNYSKELWGEDAEEFRPERWMAPGQANAGGASSNYAFLTFLHGPRSCIGERFARAELMALLGAFVGKFEFEMKNPEELEKISIKGGVTARPRDGLHLRVREVGGW
jgi:cytochrome P450